MPPFASTSALRNLRSRSLPILATSVSLFAAHTYLSQPIHNDSEDSQIDSLATSLKKQKIAISAALSPYTPLGWGSNKNLTLNPDSSVATLKRPTPLPQLGSTPLRDLIVHEKYGACLDARGDIWMWGAGYDPSGAVGKSLRGKKLKTLAPGPSKLFALGKDGRLYVVPTDKKLQVTRHDKQELGWWSWMFGTDAGVDFVELQAEGGLKRGEKWTAISAGKNHLLATTSSGRTFSLPLSPQGNSHRQLGTRQTFDTATPSTSTIDPASDPRFCTTLSLIPSLSSISISSVSTSANTSFVLTPAGRVLGFGANESGQIGLGLLTAVETVATPVEVVLARGYPGGTHVKCLDVKAGGSTTFFVVERSNPGKDDRFIDLLACGSGSSGALGNGLWSSANGSPSKVKTVSGLQEFSEKANQFLPLDIHTVSVSPSPNAHVYAVLDTVSQADEAGVLAGRYGKDVMVWGGNAEFQLGNGKRSSLAIPQHLPPLIPKAIDALSTLPSSESSLSSGTSSPMPHSRLQLHQSKTNAYDLEGKLIKRNVKVEETVVAGWNASVLYNKIID
ncbi:hypothetical protein P7C73_g1683, partial [Tremellales sp. Uapishka_1]